MRNNRKAHIRVEPADNFTRNEFPSRRRKEKRKDRQIEISKLKESGCRVRELCFEDDKMAGRKGEKAIGLAEVEVATDVPILEPLRGEIEVPIAGFQFLMKARLITESLAFLSAFRLARPAWRLAQPEACGKRLSPLLIWKRDAWKLRGIHQLNPRLGLWAARLARWGGPRSARLARRGRPDCPRQSREPCPRPRNGPNPKKRLGRARISSFWFLLFEAPLRERRKKAYWTKIGSERKKVKVRRG